MLTTESNPSKAFRSGKSRKTTPMSLVILTWTAMDYLVSPESRVVLRHSEQAKIAEQMMSPLGILASWTTLPGNGTGEGCSG
jgi:hypothetical protein